MKLEKKREKQRLTQQQLEATIKQLDELRHQNNELG